MNRTYFTHVKFMVDFMSNCHLSVKPRSLRGQLDVIGIEPTLRVVSTMRPSMRRVALTIRPWLCPYVLESLCPCVHESLDK